MLDIKVILDTDADNEIDDQYAIAYLLKSNKVNVLGITAVPYYNHKVSSAEEGMIKSYNETKKVISLCDLEGETPLVFEGSRQFLTNEQDYIPSPACDFIIQEALKCTESEPLYVLAIGALTNVASAIIKNPAITKLIHVVFLGGTALHMQGLASEFNMSEDVLAGSVVFKSVDKLTVLPCPGVVSALTTSEPELKYWLHGKNELCTYLVEHTVEEANTYAKGKPWTRVIWDVSTIWHVLNPEEAARFTKKVDRFYPVDDMNYETYEGSPINYVYQVDRDRIFNELFTVLAK